MFEYAMDAEMDVAPPQKLLVSVNTDLLFTLFSLFSLLTLLTLLTLLSLLS